ncbi:MAG: MBL fold metallo-hydrolase [Leptospirales bacterium]
MKSLECIIFNVDHGFCAFIKSPNDYGLLIDAGSKNLFSPVKYVKNAYPGGISFFEKRRIAELIITHLHADHFSDVGNLKDAQKPKHLSRDKSTLAQMRSKIKNAKNDDSGIKLLKEFDTFQKAYDKDSGDEPNWGFDYFDKRQITYTTANKISESDDKLINNRSYITVIEFAGKRILFPGDIEVAGWDKFLGNATNQKHINNINFFIASHHGHKSGFTKSILDYTGKPDLFIVSAKSGDEHIDSSYSNIEYSKGYLITDDSKKSKMVSTREKQSSIKIIINEDGTTSVSYLETKNNLNENQAFKRDRALKRYKKIYQ